MHSWATLVTILRELVVYQNPNKQLSKTSVHYTTATVFAHRT